MNVVTSVVNIGVTITSLQYSPSGEDLVIGMSNGVVSLLKGKTKTLALQHTLDFSTQVVVTQTHREEARPMHNM